MLKCILPSIVLLACLLCSNTVRAEATVTSVTPIGIEPAKTTRIVLTGTAFSEPLRVWTSCDAKIAVVKVEPTQATLDVTPPADAPLGSFGLWLATAEGQLIR